MSSIFRQFEHIRSSAQTGLNYSHNLPSHRALYSEIIAACQDMAQSVSTDGYQPSAWSNMLSELGCITPKVGSVIGILRADGHLLVLQRPSGRWCLPCGYADIGETPEDTAIRETLEEMGLDITQLELLRVATTKGDESVAFMWEAVFFAHTSSDNVLLSHEHLAAEWISSVDDRDWHSTHQQHALAVFDAATRNSVSWSPEIE